MKTYPVEKENPNKIRAVKSNQYRTPKKGEYYLSGAIPMAYISPNDIGQKFWIAKIVKVKKVIEYVIIGG